MKGKVKFYNRSKDFGFIAGENGQEYYFNAASLKVPQDDEAVDFETLKTARGEIAKQVVFAGVGQAVAGVSKCPVKKRPLCFLVTAGVVIAAFLLGHYLG